MNYKNNRRTTQYRNKEWEEGEEREKERDHERKGKGKNNLNVVFWNVSGTVSMKEEDWEYEKNGKGTRKWCMAGEEKKGQDDILCR